MASSRMENKRLNSQSVLSRKNDNGGINVPILNYRDKVEKTAWYRYKDIQINEIGQRTQKKTQVQPHNFLQNYQNCIQEKQSSLANEDTENEFPQTEL